MNSDSWLQQSCRNRSRPRRWLPGAKLAFLITALLSFACFSHAQVAQTLSWEAPAVGNILRLHQPYDLKAASSSGLPVSFRIEQGPAEIADGRATANGVGTIVITAEQAGSAEFLPVQERRTFNQTKINLTQLGEWPNYPRGPVSDMSVQGNLAYLSLSVGGLVILDVRDPENPLVLGSCRSIGLTSGILVADGYAYLKISSYPKIGLQVIDVRDPANPVPVAEYRTVGVPRGLWKEGPLLFIAGWGVEILDVSHLPAIVPRGNLSVEGTAFGVQVVGNLAYVISSWDFEIFDIGQPESPLPVGKVGPLLGLSQVAVAGRFAYLTGENSVLEIFDVSDARRPLHLAHAEPGVRGQATALRPEGNLAYVSTSAGLLLFDVTNPSLPRLSALFQPENSYGSVQVSGDRVYLVSPEQGLQILSATNPPNLNILGKYAVPGFAQAIQVAGDLAYIADGDRGLRILDIGNPSAPKQVGAFDTGGNAAGLEIQDNLAYVADTTQGLLVLDVKNPTAPALLGKNSVQTGRRVRVSGNLAYLAGPSTGFGVLDVGNPASPILVGKADSFQQLNDLQVLEGVAYLASLNGSFYTVRADDPSHLTTFSERGYPDRLAGIQVANGKTYVVGSQLYIFDTTDPQVPENIGHRYVSNAATSVKIRDGAAYMTTVAGLEVWDVNDPRDPVAIGGFYARDSWQDVQVRGNLAYVAGGNGGVKILQLDQGLDPSLVFSPPSPVIKDTSNPVEVPLTATTQSGQPITFTIISGPATLSGNSLTVTNVGPIVLRAESAASEQFFAGSVEQVIWAQKKVPARQGIDFAPLPKIVDLRRIGEANLFASASSGLPVKFTVLIGPAVLDGSRLILTNTGTVVVRAEQAGNAEFLPTFADQTVVAATPVVLLRQPVPKNSPLGSAAVLDVLATGSDPVSYQWFQNGVKIEGANSARLELAGLAKTNSGFYHVIVTNAYNSVTSSVVSLSVDSPGSELLLRPRGNVALRTSLPPRDGPARIELQGNYAFVTDLALSSAKIFDISDPDSPSPVASIPFKGTSHEDSALANGYLFLAERENGLGLVDVHDPTKPVRLPTIVIPGNKRDVVTIRVQDNLAYVGDGTFGLVVLDVSTPTNAVYLGGLDTPGIAAGVALRDHTAYIADWQGGLQVVDVVNPRSPLLLGKFPKQGAFNGYLYDLVLKDQVALVAAPASGSLLSFDLTNLQDIRKVTAVPGQIWGLDIADRFLFAADNGLLTSLRNIPTGGLRVFDVTDPLNPRSFGRFTDWGTVDGILLKDNRLFVAGTRFGIIDLAFGKPPTLGIRSDSHGLHMEWPLLPEGFVLESAASLAGEAAWDLVKEPVVANGDSNTVSVSGEGTTRFYRLRQN